MTSDEDARELQAACDELEDSFDAIEEALQRRLDLLAWTLRQAKVMAPVSDPENWPAIWVMDWPETQKVALADPLVFDLARFQMAQDLRHEPTRRLSIFQESAVLENAALILEAAPPSSKGLPIGRSAVKMLLRDIAWELRELPSLWSLRAAKEPYTPERNLDPWRLPPLPANAALADAIADRLITHPLLADVPECALSADAIRVIIRT